MLTMLIMLLEITDAVPNRAPEDSHAASADHAPAPPSHEEWEVLRAIRALHFGSVEAVIQRRRTRFTTLPQNS